MIDDAALKQAVELIERSDSLLITAGAGMGADSGLPTFRGRAGFWHHYPALAEAGIDFQRIANPATFRSNPRLAWGFYGHRLQLYRRTTPHEGYRILLDLAQRFARGPFVYTSNVDGHFRAAGFDPQWLEECHGSIHYLQCLNDCRGRVWSADSFEPEVDESRCLLVSELPTCPDCGAVARPNILMFNDCDWNPKRNQVQSDRCLAWLSWAGRPLVIEVGAGADLPVVRGFGTRNGHRMIRINPDKWRVNSGSGVGVRGRALPVLRALHQRLSERSKPET